MVRRPAGRLNIIFDGIDSEEELERRFADAVSRRRVAKSFLAEERIVVRELALQYRDISLSKEARARIVDLVLQRANVTGHRGAEIFQTCVMQVEALYVYETLRSVILSQIGDPRIIQLAKKHDMCAKPLVDHKNAHELSYEQPNASAERRKDMLCAIESLRHTGFSSKRAIDLLAEILKVNQLVLDAAPQFEVPDLLSDESVDHILSLKAFEAYDAMSLRKGLQETPLDVKLL
jgi:hypothetical protein